MGAAVAGGDPPRRAAGGHGLDLDRLPAVRSERPAPRDRIPVSRAARAVPGGEPEGGGRGRDSAPPRRLGAEASGRGGRRMRMRSAMWGAMLAAGAAIVGRAAFFLNDTPTTEIYTLSLHDALPISHLHRLHAHEAEAEEDHVRRGGGEAGERGRAVGHALDDVAEAREARRHGRACFGVALDVRSEEHTSELQSLTNLVCRLLLEKKK